MEIVGDLKSLGGRTGREWFISPDFCCIQRNKNQGKIIFPNGINRVSDFRRSVRNIIFKCDLDETLSQANTFRGF